MVDALHIKIGVDQILNEMAEVGTTQIHITSSLDKMLNHLEMIGIWIRGLELGLWNDFHTILQQQYEKLEASDKLATTTIPVALARIKDSLEEGVSGSKDELVNKKSKIGKSEEELLGDIVSKLNSVHIKAVSITTTINPCVYVLLPSSTNIACNAITKFIQETCG